MSPKPRWIARGVDLLATGRPLVMGILNVTPDSFSDGGRAATVAEAVSRARWMAEQGVDIIDIGGESSRPGAEPVGEAEELRRVLPVIEALAGEVALPLSLDTVRGSVARRGLAAGVAIINDISALGDPETAAAVAEHGAGLVLMHMQGEPRTMQVSPSYRDVVADVYEYLAARMTLAEEAGIAREQIVVDPGIGFGKTFEHNLTLLRNLGQFASLGSPLLVGLSRKGYLGQITGRAVEDRQVATAVASLLAVQGGAAIVRVHDVDAMVDTLKVWAAMRTETA